MTKRTKKMMACIMSLTLVASALTPMPSTYAAKKVKLNKTKISLTVGSSSKLKVKNTKKKVKWSSSNKKVAIVTSKGKVLAKKAGSCKIKAKVAKKTYTCKVTVKVKSGASTSLSPSPSPSASTTPLKPGSAGGSSVASNSAVSSSSTKVTTTPTIAPNTTTKPSNAPTYSPAQEDVVSTRTPATSRPSDNDEDEDVVSTRTPATSRPSYDDEDEDFVSTTTTPAPFATPTVVPSMTPDENDSDKNASDVAALKALIAEQTALGANIDEDIDSYNYEWDDNGRLCSIYWSYSDLKGSISFKNLPELTTITCSYNDLTNIDVTQNTKLRILYCYNNANLASIDLKNNSALFSLKCKNTKITTLDLSVCDEDIKSYLSCDANVTVTYPDGTTSVTSEDEFTSEDDE